MCGSNFQLFIPILFAIASCTGENGPHATQSDSIVVPIRLVEVDPLIEVRVNGIPIDVQFDMGRGGNLALFQSQLSRLDGKTQVDTSVGGVAMDGPTGGGHPIYQVDLVQVGDFSNKNARIAEDFHDKAFQESFSSRLDAFGFIGRGFFKELKIIIDYPQRRLTIIPPNAPAEQQAACRGMEVSLVEGTDWGLVSNATTDIGEIVLVWDTGAPFNAVFKKRTDADELGYSEGDTLPLEQFVLNGHDFGRTTFEILDWGDNQPPFDGFIGYNFFSTHVVCVDLPKNRIFVQH